MRYLKREDGLTLLEVIIGTAIFAVVFAGIAIAFQGMVKSQDYNYQSGANNIDGNTVMRLIAKEIKYARDIEKPLRGMDGSSILDYTYMDNGTIKQGHIFVQENAIVIRKDTTDIRLAAGRAWNSTSLLSNDGSLFFIYNDDSGSKALIDVTLKLHDISKEKQLHPQLEFQTTISTLNDI